MKYMGSKRRLAKDIVAIAKKEKTYLDQWWVEPFVGGGNLITEVPFRNKLGADRNPDTISALVSIRDHLVELPKDNRDFSELDYYIARDNKSYPHRGYIGFALSYGGKWFGGWCRDKEGRRDYVREAHNNATSQSKKLGGIALLCSDFRSLDIPENSIVYCDPPYRGTTKYAGDLDHEAFFAWCRDLVLKGHVVLVSEYEAPGDFECIYQRKMSSSLEGDTGKKYAVEKVFKLGSAYSWM
jgi:DNA adenine methylase